MKNDSLYSSFKSIQLTKQQHVEDIQKTYEISVYTHKTVAKGYSNLLPLATVNQIISPPLSLPCHC